MTIGDDREDGLSQLFGGIAEPEPAESGPVPTVQPGAPVPPAGAAPAQPAVPSQPAVPAQPAAPAQPFAAAEPRMPVPQMPPPQTPAFPMPTPQAPPTPASPLPTAEPWAPQRTPEPPPLPSRRSLRAPEHDGADELAAAPSGLRVSDAPPYPAPTGPASTMTPSYPPVSPRAFPPGDPAAATPSPVEPATARSVPGTPPQPTASVPVTPAEPVIPAEPVRTPEPASRRAPAVAAPAAGGGALLVVPAGPLLPAAEPTDIPDPDELAAPTRGEWAALAASVVLPPVGLALGVVQAVRSSRRRGWVTGFLRATIAVGAVATVIAGLLGAWVWNLQVAAMERDRLLAASAGFCAMIAETPEMIEPPTLGWPPLAETVPESIAAMQAYADRWIALAEVSPPEIAPGAERMAQATAEIIDEVEATRILDDAANIAAIHAAAGESGIPEWHGEFCRAG